VAPVRIPKLYNGKDKTFFFLTYEGTRNRDPRFNLRSVPTALERQGDFSQSFTSHLNVSNIAHPTEGARVIDKIHIYNPYQFESPTSKNRVEFPSDVIPARHDQPDCQSHFAVRPASQQAERSPLGVR